MRKAVVLSVAAAAVTTTLAAPALAACGTNVGDICSGTTTVAFAVINTGSLSIVPTAVAPATGTSVDAAGKRTVTVGLGVTSVLDSRTSSPGWTSSATAGDFTGTTSSSNKVLGSGAKFFVGSTPVTAAAGLLTGLLASATCPAGVTYVSTPTGTNGSAALVTAPAGAISACSYTPSLQLDVTSAPADTYTGTVTQSVS